MSTVLAVVFGLFAVGSFILGVYIPREKKYSNSCVYAGIVFFVVFCLLFGQYWRNDGMASATPIAYADGYKEGLAKGKDLYEGRPMAVSRLSNGFYTNNAFILGKEGEALMVLTNHSGEMLFTRGGVLTTERVSVAEATQLVVEYGQVRTFVSNPKSRALWQGFNEAVVQASMSQKQAPKRSSQQVVINRRK